MKTIAKFYKDLKQFNDVKLQGKNVTADLHGNIETGINANCIHVEMLVKDVELVLTNEDAQHVKATFITYFSNKGYKLFHAGEHRFKLVF